MAVLQIIYLAINVIGIVAGSIYFVTAADCNIFSNIFTFVHKYLKNIGLVIVTVLLILLLLPTIAVLSAIITFITVYIAYSDLSSED